MIEILSVIGVAVIVMVMFRARGPFSPPKTHMPPARIFKYYEAVPSLFVNRSERLFYQMLKHRVPQRYDIHAKVRLEDIIRVSSRVKSPRDVWRLRGRVKSRHVDFLITAQGGRPIVVIELDGTAHENSAAVAADALKNGVFQASSIAFYRVNTDEDFAQKIDAIVAKLP